MKLNDLERHLREQGCHLERQGGNHTLWKNPAKGKVAPVPRHREVKEGTVRSVRSQREACHSQLGTAPSAHAIRLAKPHWAVHLPGMKTLSRKTDDLIGTYRTFGEAGPVYEVVRKVDGATVHIVVVETGEELNYPAAEALNDPEAE